MLLLCPYCLPELYPGKTIWAMDTTGADYLWQVTGKVKASIHFMSHRHTYRQTDGKPKSPLCISTGVLKRTNLASLCISTGELKNA